MSVNSWFEDIVVPTPAAGAIVTRRIPGETFEEYWTVRANLATSVVVANRIVSLVWQDGDGNTVMQVPQSLVVAAATTALLTWAHGMDTNSPAGSNLSVEPIPLIKMPSGWSLALSVINLDVGDQLSNVRLWVNRYPTGPSPIATGAHAFIPGIVG